MTRAVDVLGAEGTLPTLREARFVLGSYLGHPLRTQLGVRDSVFHVNGRPLPYERVAYAGAWRTERSVEVPLARDVVRRAQPSRMLEIGNVLANYGVRGHDVVDKYEVAPGVANIDVVDLDRAAAYDLVIAVSTLEHVGFDEHPQDPSKLRTALTALRRCVARDGQLFVTLPLGYNPTVDQGLAEDELGFTEGVYLKRISRANEWLQVPALSVQGERYDAPFPKANAVFAGLWRPA